jgi:hypothetical protein
MTGSATWVKTSQIENNPSELDFACTASFAWDTAGKRANDQRALSVINGRYWSIRVNLSESIKVPLIH